MSDFMIQRYSDGELVNTSQMNNFYQGKDQITSAYQPIAPAILNGLSITQTGTSNVFAFSSGQLRFLDQVNVNSPTVPQLTISNIPAITSITINIGGTGSSPQYYIVAVLTQTVNNTNSLTNTATISPTAMTLAQIAAQTIPANYAPIYTITTPDNTIYTIGTDSNCAGLIGFPDIIDNPQQGNVTIGGRILGSFAKLQAINGSPTTQRGCKAIANLYGGMGASPQLDVGITENNGTTINSAWTFYYNQAPQLNGDIANITRLSNSPLLLRDSNAFSAVSGNASYQLSSVYGVNNIYGVTVTGDASVTGVESYAQIIITLPFKNVAVGTVANGQLNVYGIAQTIVPLLATAKIASGSYQMILLASFNTIISGMNLDFSYSITFRGAL